MMNIKINKIFFTSIWVALVVVLASCQSDKDRERKYNQESKLRGKFIYPKIEDAKLALEILSSRREFYAGEDVELTFALKNDAKKPITIYEWMMIENDNLKIYYLPLKKNQKENLKKNWNCEVPKTKQPVRRATLVLNPMNSVLINKKLQFISEMKTGRNSKIAKRYYVFAELNLESVNVRSKVLTITIK